MLILPDNTKKRVDKFMMKTILIDDLGGWDFLIGDSVSSADIFIILGGSHEFIGDGSQPPIGAPHHKTCMVEL